VDSNQNNVYDQLDSAISGSSVTVIDSNGNVLFKSTTDISGEAVFNNVFVGSYTLVLNVPGYEEKSISTTVVVNQVTIINVPLPSPPDTSGSFPTSPSSSYPPSKNKLALPTSPTPLSRSTGSIVVQAFVDSNQNSILDSNEQPVPGISVTFSDSLSTVVLKSTTDTFGQVLAENLAVGNYELTISVPEFEIQTLSTLVVSNQVTTINVPLPSMPNLADSPPRPIVQSVPSPAPGRYGEEPSTNTISSGSISGVAFEDTNGNGIQEITETFLSNVLVTITSTTSVNTVFEVSTDSNGSWQVNNIPSGVYQVSYTSPPGYNATTYVNGIIPQVVVTPAGSNWLPCGFKPITLHGTITVSVCIDLNGDLICSGSDSSISNVPVKVYPEGEEVPVAVEPTGPNGTATLQVPPGKYVVELPPSNLYNGPDFDSDGVTPSILDVPPGSFTALQAPLPNYGAIVGTVFSDFNGDGLQNPDEAGIKGLVVEVFNSSSSYAPVCTDTTDSNGMYNCSGLPLNQDYVVKPVNPYSGSEFTGANILNKETGESFPYSLTPVNTSAIHDVGVVLKGGIEGNVNAASSPPTGSISGTVWLDNNNDGVKSSGDTGMVGVNVHLGNNGDVLQSTSTDLQGSYSFPSVPVGQYTISVDNPNPAYFSFVKANNSDNNVNNYGSSEVDVTDESASTVNAGMEQKPSSKVEICTSNDRSTEGNPCNYIGTIGIF
jgi:serine-aspartate repeat-containing protein C/D/E